MILDGSGLIIEHNAAGGDMPAIRVAATTRVADTRTPGTGASAYMQRVYTWLHYTNIQYWMFHKRDCPECSCMHTSRISVLTAVPCSTSVIAAGKASCACNTLNYN